MLGRGEPHACLLTHIRRGRGAVANAAHPLNRFYRSGRRPLLKQQHRSQLPDRNRPRSEILVCNRLLAVIALFVSGCSIEPSSYTIQGVGEGSDCRFDGEFDGLFPCDNWIKTSSSPEPVTQSFAKGDVDGLIVGVAASKPIDAVSGDEVVEFQADGNMAIVRIKGMGAELVEVDFLATDGSTSECEYSFGINGGLSCDGW